VISFGKDSFDQVKIIKVIIPSPWPSVEDHTFRDYAQFQEVVINQDLKIIPQNTFSEKKLLKDITINGFKLLENGIMKFQGSGITKIEDNSFSRVPIQSMTIPDDVEFSSNSFSGCSEFEFLDIQHPLSEFNLFSIRGMSKLSNYTFDGEKKYFELCS
jgi:hypothetical protein